MPIFLECQRCTACCRWPGQVVLNDSEITRIATFLRISEHEVIQRYTRLRADRRGLALMDKSAGECVFLEENACAIQSVKPQQCRDFPNLWTFPGAEASCGAIPREVSAETWERLVREATGREAPRAFQQKL